ncbi:MAG: hypothetical protein K6G84_03190, partial [Lachnospiraceae bacterium]|nr:hypothetical protein [Lachnospiraceae bacterium]
MKISISKWCSDKTISIVFEILILLALLFYVFSVFKESRADRFDISDMQSVSKNMGYDYRLDDIKKYKSRAKKYVEVKGW